MVRAVVLFESDLHRGRSTDDHVAPDALTTRSDKTGLSQVGEMPGNGRLRELEAGMDVTDAHFAGAEQRKYSQAGFVGQGAIDIHELAGAL